MDWVDPILLAEKFQWSQGYCWLIGGQTQVLVWLQCWSPRYSVCLLVLRAGSLRPLVMVSVGPKAGKLNIGMGLRTQVSQSWGWTAGGWTWSSRKVLTLVLACSLVRLEFLAGPGANVGSLVIGALFQVSCCKASGSYKAGVSQPVDKGWILA